MSDETLPTNNEIEYTRTIATGAGGSEAEPGGLPAEIDGYKFLGVLGQGGMGVVYLAEQNEPRRRVAIKLMRGSAHTDALHVRLFRREADMLGRLRHPNIGAIYGAGRLRDGRPYFAMELVEGPTLDVYLAPRPSPSNRAELLHRLALAGRIAEAVHYAHQRGIIHRDLKPSNIVIPTPSEGTAATTSSAAALDVKILDFGLARLTDDDSQGSVMSDVGTIRGTLPYMSPEQVRGETQSLDVRSDVYALGVILYEMLAGERPYDVSRVSLPEAMRVISEQDPRALRDTPSGLLKVDSDLQAIVLKALAKEPERRYSSAAALAEDLERYRNSQPVLARTPSTAYQLRKLVARHRPLTAALAVALVAIIASAIVSTGMYLRARTEAAKSKQVAAFLSDMLEGAGPSVARGRDTALLREILDRTAQRVRTELRGQPDVAAGIEHVLGRTYLQIGDLLAADQHARAAYEAHSLVRRAPHEDLADDLSLLADVYWNRGQLARADSVGHAALAMWRALYTGPNAGTAQALTALGGINLDASQPEQAEPLIREGLAMSQTLYPKGDRTVAVGLNSLGNLMHYSGRFDEADSLQTLALAMHRRLGGDLDPDVATDLLNFAMIETDRGRFGRAESLAHAGLAICKRIYTDDHPNTAAGLITLGGIYYRTGATARAESLAQQALTVARGIRGAGSPTVGDALSALGVFADTPGREEEVLSYHRQALAAFRSAGDAGASKMGTALDNLASALAGVGRFDAADSVYREAIPLKVAANGATNPQTLLTKNNYARMQYSRGHVASAEALFRDVLAGRRKALGENNDQVAVTMSDLARAVQARGRLAEAESLLTRAVSITKATLGPDAMNTNFASTSLARVHREQGQHAKAATEMRDARKRLMVVLGDAGPDMVWMNCELAATLGSGGPSREADSLFAWLAHIPVAQIPPTEALRFHVNYGLYLAKVGRDAEAEKYLLLAEQSLRDPRENNVRRRLQVLDALVDVESRWAKRAPSPARTAALKRWTAVRDAEAPELRAAIAAGRPPRVAALK